MRKWTHSLAAVLVLPTSSGVMRVHLSAEGCNIYLSNLSMGIKAVFLTVEERGRQARQMSLVEV